MSRVPEATYRECPVYMMGRRKPIGYTSFENARVAVEKWKVAEWYRDGIIVYDFMGLIALGLTS
jgi:hypothetical protein